MSMHDNNIANALREHLVRYSWDKSLPQMRENTPVVLYQESKKGAVDYGNDSGRSTECEI